MLFNNASKNLANLMCTVVGDDNGNPTFDYKHVFNGGNGLVDMDKDTFVKDSMKKRYGKMGITFKDDVVSKIRQNDDNTLAEDVKKIEGLLKAAHGSLHELGVYCESVYGMFNHMLRAHRFGGAYKTLSDAFGQTVEEKANDWHWAAVMKKVKDGNLQLSDLVTEDGNNALTEIEVAKNSEAVGYKGYSEASMKEFKRKMCQKLLESHLTQNDLFTNNNFTLSSDANRLHGASADEIAKNSNKSVPDPAGGTVSVPAWTLFVESLTIDGDVAEVGYLKSLGANIFDNIDGKALSLSPESEMWAADMKGQILISNEPTHTIQIENLSDSVSLKKTSNNVVYKEDDQMVKERAVEHIKAVLLTLGQ